MLLKSIKLSLTNLREDFRAIFYPNSTFGMGWLKKISDRETLVKISYINTIISINTILQNNMLLNVFKVDTQVTSFALFVFSVFI